MRRAWHWIVSVVSVAYGGSAVVDASDGDPARSPADEAAPRWVALTSVLAPLVVIVLAVLGVPWPMVAVVAALMLTPLVFNRVIELRSRR